MLTQKQKELPYVAVFKTSSGEEFIAKVVDENLGAFIVERPLCLVVTAQGASFAPFMMMADPTKTVTIPKPIVNTVPPANVESQYEQATSGIALPKKQGIIT